MGRQYIEGFLDQGIRQDQAIRIQLQNNHYPPYSDKFVDAMLPIIKKAIKWGNETNANYELGLPIESKRFRLPKGMEFRGSKYVDASDVIESFHLDSFLDPINEEM